MFTEIILILIVILAPLFLNMKLILLQNKSFTVKNGVIRRFSNGSCAISSCCALLCSFNYLQHS